MQVEVALESVFAAKKGRDRSLAPGAFQVSAKIDEEARKDNRLDLSFLITLSDPKSMATYEFRGFCGVTGNPAGFDHLMGSPDGSRLPRILDVIYQKLYPSVFMLAGMTSSPYPQSVALVSQELTVSEPEEGGVVVEAADDAAAAVAVKPEAGGQEPALQAQPQS